MSSHSPNYAQKVRTWCRANKDFVAVVVLTVAILFVGFRLSDIADSLRSIRIELRDIDLSISSIANRQ